MIFGKNNDNLRLRLPAVFLAWSFLLGPAPMSLAETSPQTQLDGGSNDWNTEQLLKSLAKNRPAEVRFIDPWGNNVDLSSRGYLGREEKKLPGVRMLAVQVPDLAAACEFYQEQFGLQIAGWSDDGTIRLSDGTLTLMLTKSQIRPKTGVQYFGIQVGDLGGLKQRLQDGGVTATESGEGQIQFNDPEGNRVVVSQSGWAN
jgi:predicted enzyme related to lactoylglutathione lyase